MVPLQGQGVQGLIVAKKRARVAPKGPIFQVLVPPHNWQHDKGLWGTLLARHGPVSDLGFAAMMSACQDWRS